MAAYTTTRVTNFTLPTTNENWVSITDGSNTFKLTGAPPSTSTNELVAVGKVVFEGATQTLYSAAYKVTKSNGDISWDLFVGKVNNSSSDLQYVANYSDLANPGFAESLVGVDLNNNGTIGPTNLTVVSQTINNRTVADGGNELLAKDTSGNFYFLDKTNGTAQNHKLNSVEVGGTYYDVLIARDSGGMILRTDTLDYANSNGNANSSRAVAVVKSDQAPPSQMPGGGTLNQTVTPAYYVLIKHIREGQATQWQIKKFSLTGELDNSFWSNETSRVSQYETFFKQDLNGDGNENASPAPTDISTDSITDGVVAGKNIDGDIFIRDGNTTKAVKPTMPGSPSIENTSPTNTSQVIAATDGGQTSGTYLLAVKNTVRDPQGTTKAPTITWDVYTVRDKDAYALAYPSNSTMPGMSTSNIGTNELVYSTMNQGDRASDVAIADFEIRFDQDLNGDGTKGLVTANILSMASDTQGVRLERDRTDKSLYIAKYNGTTRDLKAIVSSTPLEFNNQNPGWKDQKEAIAIEAIKNGNNDITGYKLAIKRTQYSDTGSPTMTAGPAGAMGSGTKDAPKVTWDILLLDADGKVNNGSYDSNNMWKDDTIRDLQSITPYESFFGEDLNGDGKAGVDASSLTMSPLDKSGIKLGRDSEKSLYIVNGSQVKSVGNTSWLEYSNSWTNGNGGTNSNETKAVAVEAIRDNSNAITGYKLALKRTDTFDGVSNVSWDILRLDADAKVTYGSFVNNAWRDESVRGQKSIAPFEEFFGDDLNEDGRTGVDLASLTKASTDTNGILLARDKENSLYLLDGNNAKAVSASWLEYSNAWGTGSNKKEAIAVEAVRNNSGTITGYKMALKQTDVYDGKTTINWEVITLTADAKLENASGAAMTGGSSQTKSISAFEDVFNQDLNGDGRIGIDTASLVQVSTDTTGLYLARDAEKALYIVNGNSAKAVGNSSWLEYDNSWGSGSNKREAIAVEAVRDGNGNITAYKLAMKQTNNWNGTDNVTWDVLHLDTDAKITYGSWSGAENKWVDNSVYGVKSMVAYETLFNQDLNNDGKIGIDVATLKMATTDTRGVRLARDKDNALFIVDGAGAAAVAKAVGNASWLEYDNSWGGGSNKMEAMAVEATLDGNNTVTGYKLALKQTNDWNGNKDENWQVLNLDAQGSVSWGGTAGGALWTKKIRQVENLVKEDLNNDGTVGISTNSLTAFTEAGLTGADDNVKLAQDSADKAFYIMDNSTAITLMDTFGSTPELAYTRQWGSGSSTAEVMGVAKQTVGNDYQFRIAVKVTNTYGTSSDVSWQIHTVSKDGVLDWTKVATARSPGRFESIFGQDLDGVTSATPTAIATDTGTVKLLKDDAGVLYIQDTADTDNNGITYLVDAQGGSPAFDFDTGNLKSESYAIHKLNDGTYRLAVKKTSSNQTVKWEVYNVGTRNAATDEAVINRSKTVFLKDVRDVEALIQQNIDSDNIIGRPQEKTVVTGDVGDVKAYLTNIDKAIYINDTLQVVDAFGVGVVLNKSSTWDSGKSSFVAEVVAAASKTVNTTTTYKIAVKETTTLQNETPDVLWKIYTVDPTTGLMTAKPVETKSIARFESDFGQDLDLDLSTGIVQSALNTLTGDSDVALDDNGAVYVRNSGSLIQVTDGADGAISFESSETLPDGFSTSKVVGAQAQDSGDILLAVEYASTVGDVSDKSWVVHTLTVQGTGASAYASIDWAKAVVTDDMSDYAALFGQTFSQDVATLGA